MTVISERPAMRAGLEGVPIHDPEIPPRAIDLSDNTNRWGAPPIAAATVASLDADAMSRYPSSYSTELAVAIAEYAGVDPSMVVTGCGSDDVLDSAIRAFGDAGATLAHIDPTFTMIPAFARVNGLVPRAVCLTSDFDADAAALVENASIVYLCSPNNPTGTLLRRETIERVLRSATGLVIVDEAYYEFTGATVVDLVRSSTKLLVTRTFSKAFGLAGLRVGYGIGAPALIECIRRSRGPYRVNAVAHRAATTALREDRAWVQARVRDATAMRQHLDAALRAMSLEPLPSHTNFLLLPIHDAHAVASRMCALGVVVRPLSSLPPVSAALARTQGDALRLTVGPAPEIEMLLGALREAIACA